MKVIVKLLRRKIVEFGDRGDGFMRYTWILISKNIIEKDVLWIAFYQVGIDQAYFGASGHKFVEPPEHKIVASFLGLRIIKVWQRIGWDI